MPNRQNAQHGTAADSGAVYSPRLCNEDLAPTRDQNWSWYNIFSFWMSDVHSMGGYVVAASFFTLGLASWQVLLCLLIGICIVQLCANLVAKPSQMAGVPYAVICRQAFGVFGANIPAVIRGLIAFAWYGIQTYLAANALMLVALKFCLHSRRSPPVRSWACRILAGSVLLSCGCCRRWSSGTA